ncbi:arginyltransferase [Gluconobacter japonicus]|uniref:arginyltransferase n=1 Tax=Gluconobacter japonicus TaxID=376620 RepID=UPI0039EB2594
MQHRPQLFYTTEPAPCPYLPNRMERKVLTDLSGPDAASLHDRLSQAGFRRSHTIAYAPVCMDCRACKPMRLPVALFRPSRTQQRIWKRHQDVKAAITAPIPTQEQFALFQAYQKSRHTDGDMAHMSWQDYADLISNTPVETIVIEFRTSADQLVCVSLVDVMSDGLSAVYTFYDPTTPAASWGTFSILWLLHLAKQRGHLHLYLGYYVPGSQKMAYKATFQPAEIFQGGHWTPLILSA